MKRRASHGADIADVRREAAEEYIGLAGRVCRRRAGRACDIQQRPARGRQAARELRGVQSAQVGRARLSARDRREPLGGSDQQPGSVASSLRFAVQVFFGPASALNTPRVPEEPPKWMRVPVEILVLLWKALRVVLWKWLRPIMGKVAVYAAVMVGVVLLVVVLVSRL